ncbi:hypothetical protein [Bradyrhizobium sp.]|uniref:hypothetical protein n=1 Tax=Bradyrhizobium sp. TaxID=376 RepID=UPI004037D8A9
MSENTAAVSLISEGEQYELLASDDRTSFVLRSKADLSVARLQGEDAARFQADYETVKQQFPDWKPDQALAQLWDQGGYSWLATQEAD